MPDENAGRPSFFTPTPTPTFHLPFPSWRAARARVERTLSPSAFRSPTKNATIRVSPPGPTRSTCPPWGFTLADRVMDDQRRRPAAGGARFPAAEP
jgi:hypothetical protein